VEAGTTVTTTMKCLKSTTTVNGVVAVTTKHAAAQLLAKSIQ
jgi:hypothetical protein